MLNYKILLKFLEDELFVLLDVTNCFNATKSFHKYKMESSFQDRIIGIGKYLSFYVDIETDMVHSIELGDGQFGTNLDVQYIMSVMRDKKLKELC